MNRKLVTLLLLISSLKINATCIVIFKTSNGFTVASDSRASYRGLKEPDTICKIHKANSYYIAISGFDYNSIYKMAVYASTKESNAINTFSDTTVKYYKSKLSVIRKRDIETYNELLRRKGLCSIAFMWYKSNKPILSYIEFGLDENSSGEIIITPYLINDMHEVYLGEIDHIIKLPKIDIRSIEKKNKDSLRFIAKEYIKKEISFHPDSISEPIDIIEISQKGMKWVSPIRKCD